MYFSADEDWFGAVEPDFIEALASRFIREGETPRDYGFKLIPDGFTGPVSDAQRRAFRAVGYGLP